MDTSWHSSAEPGLTTDEWRVLLNLDPERARRRYCHQVRLVILGLSELHSSVSEFQRLTQRHPENFYAQAYPLARRYIEPMSASQRSQEDQWLWRQITTQPYEPTNPYTSFAGPRVLVSSVIKDLAFLSSQADAWRMSLPTRPPRKSASTLSDAKGRARVRAAWHTNVWLLAVAVEEAQLPDTLPLVRSSLDQPSVLAPYPDEADWHALLISGRSAAIQRLRELHLERAKTGTIHCFNLGESIAAAQAIFSKYDSESS